MDKLDIPDVDLRMNVEDDLIQTIYAEIHQPVRLEAYRDILRQFDLNRVLSTYGPPDQVYLEIAPPVEPNSPPGYSLWVVYEDRGIAIEYFGMAEMNSAYRICSPVTSEISLYSIRFYLLSTDSMDLYKFVQIPDTAKALSSVTNVDVPEFYERFISENMRPCLDSQKERW